MPAKQERRRHSTLRDLESGTLPPDDATTGMDARELVTAHLPLVGYVLRDVAAGVPGHVSRDDLHSAGLLGLVQAAATYDTARGVPFRRHAQTRIRGAMVDELRAGDPIGRRARERAKAYDEAVGRLTLLLARAPTTREVAESLSCTESELDRVRVTASQAISVPLGLSTDDDTVGALPDPGPSVEDAAIREEELGWLAAAVAGLPDRLATLVRLHYLNGQPMSEVAAALGITDSRASQLHRQALSVLREAISSEPDLRSIRPTVRPLAPVAKRRGARGGGVGRAADGYGVDRDAGPDRTPMRRSGAA